MTTPSGGSADVVIVGGGIIGLSIAWHLRREGASVLVLERGQVGGQATGAAAGMLAPLAEATAPGDFVTLGLASLSRYPAFVAALREETGLDAELSGPGMVRTATGEREAEALRHEFVWQQRLDSPRDLPRDFALDSPLEWLSGAEARKLEPSLAPDIEAAVLSPSEKHVEPRRLARSLALANARRGVGIHEGTPVCGFETVGTRVTGVRTPDRTFGCGQVVIAGGAWTDTIGGWLGEILPLFPVRGQILALSCLPPPFRHTVYTHTGYLVPKMDGRVVIGATEDRAGYDTRPTAYGMMRLLNFAVNQMPVLASAPFESVWAGLRPASADGLPIIGPLPRWENATVAAGHFRNGILLAPITGELVAQSLLKGGLPPLLAAFGADRFTDKITVSAR